LSNFYDNASSVVEQILNYGQVLRSERVISYLDFVEQLTYLLFLKLDYEYIHPPFKKKTSKIPKDLNWKTLISKEGNELESQYTDILNELSTHKGTAGVIFRQSRNNIREPAKLRRLINLVDKVVWLGETKSLIELYTNALNYCIDEIEDNLGQYFPPTSLIETIVKVIKPEPKKTICDPSCGIGEHLITAYNFITENYQLDKEEKSFLKLECFKGQINHDVIAKLCAMNLFLHGIGGDKNPIVVEDALVSNPSDKFDFVFVNPAFGKKKKLITNETRKKEEIVYERDDFIKTSSIHLNFLQHVKTLLKINGEAAIFVPDNVLFEGGAGATIRKKILHDCDVHTLLRLPTGIYRKTGVKANVLFFDKKPASEKHWTDKLWIYDLRTNMHFTEKTDTLQEKDLKDFIKCYNPDNRWDRKNTKRFKSFSYDELMKRDKVSLDIFWLKDESLEDSESLQSPRIIAKEIRRNLESATKLFAEIEKKLPS